MVIHPQSPSLSSHSIKEPPLFCCFPPVCFLVPGVAPQKPQAVFFPSLLVCWLWDSKQDSSPIRCPALLYHTFQFPGDWVGRPSPSEAGCACTTFSWPSILSTRVTKQVLGPDIVLARTCMSEPAGLTWCDLVLKTRAAWETQAPDLVPL